ncbi:MAG: sensor histidine kinase [Spirochaetaceae bacterium]
MSKNLKKIRIIILVFGVILFSLLAISTTVKDSLDEDYIGFQLFQSQLKNNQFLITSSIFDSKEYRSKDVNKLVNELDISFYISKDSTILSFYRQINKEYDISINILEEQWGLFTDFFLMDKAVTAKEARDAFYKVIIKADVISANLHSLENSWRTFYIIILSIHLFVSVSLLIAVFFLINNKESGGSGIMSVRNALIQGQEQERLRISLELHDKVAQDMFACRMIINEIAGATNDEGLTSSFDKSVTLLDASIKEVRDLSYSLRPPALQAIGIDSAIQSYIDNFSIKIDTPIAFKAMGLNNKNIDETVSINLYRILQETLNNTAKHAHAEHIDVKLIYTYPYLLLKIEDDGVGFKYVKSEMKAKGRNKLGLPGIKERVSLLGGELIINTDKGEGTKILIKVPVEANEKV